jgi:phage tail sheath protein FI
MLAAVQAINGCFYAQCIIDVDDVAIQNYSAVPAWKSTNNVMSQYQVLCWPKVKLGQKVFWMSTQMACLQLLVDFNNHNIPYASPSNNSLVMDSAVVNAISGQIQPTSAYTQILIPQDIGNYLNSQGVVTCINLFSLGGFKLWGNYTAAYPAITDPHQIWIPVLRMFLFFGNTTILTCFQFVDDPANLRLVETVETTMQMFVNQLVAFGALLGGDIEFLASDNPMASLLAGQFFWRSYLGGVIPA